MLCFRCGSYNPENAQKCSVCGQDFVDESGKIMGPQKKPSQAVAHAAILVPGELVAGRYRVGEQLGQGGVGAVYRARDTEIDVDVAIKGISSNLLQTDEEQKNFPKQLRLARKLQHPNIVRVYDEGVSGSPTAGAPEAPSTSGRRFFTMKLLEGLTLRKIIRLRHEKAQPFSAEELVPIFHQLGAALDYAHKSTWHGDLKPENIIILPDLLKVTDFYLMRALPLKPFMGIAKSRGKGFQYIAPELRVEAQQIDGRADVYSLGVILAEMLTGVTYEGHFSRAITAALEQLPTRLDGLVRKALTEHPDGRFAKASELARELETVLAAMDAPLPVPQRLVEPLKPGERAAVPAARKQPPPPPAETGPRAAMVAVDPVPTLRGGDRRAGQAPVAELSSSEPSQSDAHDSPDEELREPSELLEIGQSQVLLLQSGVLALGGGGDFPASAAADALRLAAKRIVRGSTESVGEASTGHAPTGHDDTIDEGAQAARSDVQTPPLGRPMAAGAHPPAVAVHQTRDAAALLAALTRDPDDDDKLIPPPVGASDPVTDREFGERIGDGLAAAARDTADDAAGASGASVDNGVDHGGDSADDSLEDTAQRRHPRLASKDAPLASSADIHDALTALKEHPRPDLMDAPPPALAAAAGVLASAVASDVSGKAAQDPAAASIARNVAGKQNGVAPRTREDSQGALVRPPKIDPDEDSLRDTLSAAELRAARERSSPNLHAAHELPPPIVVPPPLLRAVAPPAKRDTARAAIWYVAAAAAMVLAVWGLWGLAAPRMPDQAVVVRGQPDVEGHDVSPPPQLPDASPTLDAGPARVATVDPVKPDAIRTDAIRPDAVKPDAVKPDAVKPDAVKPDAVKPDAVKPDAVKPDKSVELAMATKVPDAKPDVNPDVKPDAVVAGLCPKGMAGVEAGRTRFGSDGGDPMRNFGEATATDVDVAAFCIDYYEAPNGKDSVPVTGVSWQAAKTSCERAGRRLCTEREWERACKGASGSRFPYGNSYEASACNTEDADGKPRALTGALSFKRCRSAFKVFMMAGNAEEWVLDSVNGQKLAKGGSADRPDFSSRCSARRLLSARTTSQTLGFRCCADMK